MAGKPDRKAGGQVEGFVCIQPQNRSDLPAQGRFSAILELQFPGMDRSFPRCLVCANHAFPAQDEKGRKNVEGSSPLLLNWFRAKGEIGLGCVEGFNNKAKVIT